MVAYVRVKADYDGAISLNDILLYYLISPYKILSGVRSEEFGDGVTKAIPAAEIVGVSTDPGTIDHCRNVYHAVDKFLSTSRSKGFLIDRLITYCTWIKRKDFPKPEEENKERKISTIVEEFVFNQGYFPIVRFEVGKGEPDILAAPGVDLRWDNSILIELKQIIGGRSYSPTKLKDDIGQAQDYLKIVRGIKQDIVDVVHLLIFYDGKTRRTVHKSLDVPDNVRVEFVYVGEESPSKLKVAKED